MAQVQSDGSLLGEQQSIATVLQNRTEATQTLKLLATMPATLAAAVGADPEDNTEYLSRKVISLANNGWDTSNYVSLLLQRQNPDGGFGGAVDYASNTTDSAWTVLALAQTNQATANAAINARAYLVGRLGADGGMAGRGDANRVQASALALLALQTTADGTNATALKALTSWLLQQQGADGGWLSDTYLSALALAAVSPVTADATVRSNSRNFLVARQAVDGSWGGDPFLTALVLRGLSAQYTLPSTTGGVVKGQIVDRATNAPLIGATVTLSGPDSQIASTDASGAFIVNGLTAGTYGLAFARSGYGGATATVAVKAGQTSDLGAIGLLQLATTAILRGQVIAAATNLPMAGVTITLSGTTSASTVSDATGSYELVGIAPGADIVTASFAGYQTASGSATIVAGQTLVFSPALYVNGQPAPTSIHYLGKVVSTGQAAPLAGVAVQVTGSAGMTPATTSATGQFDLTLPAGSYSATFALDGYDSVTQTFVGSAGATVDAGIVGLSPIRTTSSIKGRVFNTANVGIAGATVQVVGGTTVATTAADGSYSIDSVADTSFSIRASATGFNSQSLNLQLSKPTDVLQNFTLSAQNAGAFTIGDMTVTPSSVGSATDVMVTTSVTNTGTADGTAIVQLQVIDQDQHVIGAGIAYDTSGNLIGQLTLAAGEQRTVRLVWNSAQHPAGAYTLDARLVEAGSITRATPQGLLLTERAAIVSVTEQAHFSGSITANPPVLQAGTNTAIKLSAVIQNDGNKDVDAQMFALTVIDTKDGTVAHTEQIAGSAFAVNTLQTLTFQDWTSAKGGNFRLELTAADAGLGKVLGSLYIGDAAKASYTTNKLVVPTGTQSVRGTIKVTGQDVTTGVISDPLAPLIKAAVAKSVKYNYETAAYDTTSARCNRCHVQSQALVGGELTRALTNYSSFTASRDVILNELTTHQQANGAVDDFGGYQQTQSMLAFWALNTWHQKDEVLATLAKGGGYLTSMQAANGAWNADHASGWWSTQTANTAFNVKTLTEIYQALRQAPATTPVSYTATPWISQGIAGPYHLTSDAAGNVYVSNYGNGTISLVRPDGTTQPFMTGLQNPTALVFASDGTAYASSYAGLYRRNADGTATQITSRHGSGLAMGANGNLYMSSYWDNKIFQITPGGVASDYISGGLLSSPWGVAFSAAGDLVVANYSSRTIVRYRPDLTGQVVVTLVAGNPYALQPNGSGWLVTTASGLYSYSGDWHGQRLMYSNLGGATVTPNGTIVVGNVATNTLYNLVGAPVTAAALSAMDASIGKGTTWLLQDANTDSGNNLSLAQRLIGLNAAKLYYKGLPLADTLQAKMVVVGTQLRSRVHADGGWGWTTGYPASDSLVTAQVGVALDSLNPSASDPIVQNAVKLLLNRQKADGTWVSENNILSTPLATTTWVSIWLPTVLDRLGGVDTDLSVTFPANVKMTNPDLPPTSTTANGDGTSTTVWKMTGVTSVGRTINYDLSLLDMALNEVRPVSTDAHLTFKNSFTNGVVTAQIDIPRVQASDFLGLGVATDKLGYPADTVVNIAGQVTNTGADLSNGTVQFDIYAPDNTLVASVGSTPFGGLAAGASIAVAINWNTTRTLAGTGYYVLGSLYDSSNRLAGSAQARFNIVDAGGAAGALTAKISTDKQTYQPSEIVKLSDRATNMTVNTPLNDLRVTTTVTNPDGTVRFTQTEVLAQLPQSALKDYSYSLPLSFAPAGLYSATLDVATAGGTSLAQASTTFTVGSSAASGSGLTGTLVASPKDVPLGDAVAFNFSASNIGNSAFADLPLTVSIIDPAAQTVIAQFPYVQTIAIGGNYGAAGSWTSTGIVGTTYAAVLSASVGSKTLTLAQDTFTVIAPPIKLDITQALSNGNRVLVLISCNDGDDDIITSDGKPPVCETQRSQTIDQALTALGVAHTIVTNGTAFKLALRSGIYNTIWISGKEDKLFDSLTGEVREAAFAGDGVIFDGIHDQRNKTLDVISGIVFRGKVGETDLPIDLAAPLFPAERLATVGRALKVELGTGVQQATFNGTRPTSFGPGIITDAYGAGRAVTFAFDLVSSLQADAQWQPVLGSSLQYVLPIQPGTLTPGALLPVKTSITNLAKAVDVDVKSTLPQGGLYLGSNPSATYDANLHTVDWAFNLAEAQTKDVFLTLRVPPTAGDSTLQTIVSTVKNGTVTPYGDPLALAIHVTAAAQTAVIVQDDMKAWVLTQGKDQKLRDSLVSRLQSAMLSFNQNTASGYDDAIGGLIAMVDQLGGISSTVDTTAVHEGLDRLLKEAQWRWTLVQTP